MTEIEELTNFLKPSSRLDLKVVAIEHLLGTTASSDGRDLLLKHPDVLKQLIVLMQDECKIVAKDASICFVNISADESGSNALLLLSEGSKATVNDTKSDNLIYCCLKSILDKSSYIADPCCMILSNVSRWQTHVDRIMSMIEKCGFNWDDIINVFTVTNYNNAGANLDYLGTFLSNMSRAKDLRRYLMDADLCPLQRLLPFTEYSDSVIRRGGIVGTIKNCCFDKQQHEFLLSDQIDVLSRLLLPLAGPEEFDDEDNDKLPIDLQYLPSTKQREMDPDIRLMLLDALNQLCAKRQCREIIRNKNTYVILRELHKWEKDEAVLTACENIVNILIRTEDEIGADDLTDLKIPEDIQKKLDQLDIVENKSVEHSK